MIHFFARMNQNFHDQVLEKRAFFFSVSTCCGLKLVRVFLFLNPICQLLVLIFMYLYPGQIYALGVVCAAGFTAVKTCF